jgi:hypothetical protein
MTKRGSGFGSGIEPADRLFFQQAVELGMLGRHPPLRHRRLEVRRQFRRMIGPAGFCKNLLRALELLGRDEVAGRLAMALTSMGPRWT